MSVDAFTEPAKGIDNLDQSMMNIKNGVTGVQI